MNPEKRGLISEEDVGKFLSDYSEIINLTLKPTDDAVAFQEGTDALSLEHINKIISDNVEVVHGGHVLNIGVSGLK